MTTTNNKSAVIEMEASWQTPEGEEAWRAAIHGAHTLSDSSDASLAHWLSFRCEGLILYDAAEASWYGAPEGSGRWRKLSPSAMVGLLQDVARDALREMGNAPRDPVAEHLKALSSMRKTRDVLASLASHEHMVAASNQWDRNPYFLGTANCIVDLRTGQPVKETAGLYVRRHTTIPWAAWQEASYPHRFIEATQLILPDPEVWRYVMRALGYAITGTTKEQLWFFFYGPGDNGKTFLAETVRLILGDHAVGGYAYVGKSDTFRVSKMSNPINYGSAMNAMRGARFVVVPEVSQGELDTDLMKRLSGGDAVTYRAPYGHSDVTYTPSAHMVMYGNARPVIADSSHGNWRRLIEVPFTVQIPKAKQIQNIWNILVEEEGPGIQRLLIDAAGQYLRHGLLPVPEVIRAATADYRASSDPFALWLDECTVQEVRASVQAFRMFASYDDWCKDRNERAMSVSTFGARLGQTFTKVKRMDGTYYLGLRLAS